MVRALVLNTNYWLIDLRKYALFPQLGLRRSQMESPVLLSIFPSLSRDAYERICQIFFERFNAAGFAVLERPMAQFYAAISGTQLSGVVVDIDAHHTDVAPVVDGFVVHAARASVPLGLADCTAYLAHLFRANTSVMAALSPAATPSGTQPRWVHTPSVISQFSLPGLVRSASVCGSRSSLSGTALASAISFGIRLRTNTGCLRQMVLIACPG